MDIGDLASADKFLLYGLLLRKRRSSAEERRLYALMRSSLSLDEKIEKIMALDEERNGRTTAAEQEEKRAPRPEAGRKGGRRRGALIVDVHPELTRLLKKCSLKRRFTFTRIGESYDAVHLLRRLAVRLIVVNENLNDEDYGRFFEICRAVQPDIRIVYLGSSPRKLPPDPRFRQSTRFVQKPISVRALEEAAAELLSAGQR